MRHAQCVVIEATPLATLGFAELLCVCVCTIGAVDVCVCVRRDEHRVCRVLCARPSPISPCSRTVRIIRRSMVYIVQRVGCFATLSRPVGTRGVRRPKAKALREPCVPDVMRADMATVLPPAVRNPEASAIVVISSAVQRLVQVAPCVMQRIGIFSNHPIFRSKHAVAALRLLVEVWKFFCDVFNKLPFVAIVARLQLGASRNNVFASRWGLSVAQAGCTGFGIVLGWRPVGM